MKNSFEDGKEYYPAKDVEDDRTYETLILDGESGAHDAIALSDMFAEDAKTALRTLMEELFVDELRSCVQSAENKARDLDEKLGKQVRALEGKLNSLQLKLTKDKDGSLYDELESAKGEILSESRSFGHVVREINSGLNEVSASISTTAERLSETSSRTELRIDKQGKEIREGLTQEIDSLRRDLLQQAESSIERLQECHQKDHALLADQLRSLQRRTLHANIFISMAFMMMLLMMASILYKLF